MPRTHLFLFLAPDNGNAACLHLVSLELLDLGLVLERQLSLKVIGYDEITEALGLALDSLTSVENVVKQCDKEY